MPLTQHRLNEMWWSGYCPDSINEMSNTDFETGRDKRTKYMSAHIETCQECKNASYMRWIEANVAQEYGQDAVDLFMRGGDVTALPGAQEKIDELLTSQITAGNITTDFVQWMEGVSDRHGKIFKTCAKLERD